MSTPCSPSLYQVFAVAAVGLETLVANEIRSIAGVPTTVIPGGVAFEVSLATLFQLNRTSRLATRFLVRVGSFRARALGELKRKVVSLDWRPFLEPNRSISVVAACHKSRIYHSGAAQQRVAEALAELGNTGPVGTESAEPQKIYLRIFHDECTMSVDSTGDRLHLRGYRQNGGTAPIRETLAAAVLSLSDWDKSQILLDPMCGSGTFVIEAASVIANRDSGELRDFAMMRWPAWTGIHIVTDRCEQPILYPERPQCFGYDADAAMITKSVKNAENAAVSGWCQFSVGNIRDLYPPDGSGLIVCNPPYGWRLGSAADAAHTYTTLGCTLAQRFGGWSYAILAPNAELFRLTRLRSSQIIQLHNGGRRIILAKGRIG
ncbi:MAG: hypothetical protein HUU55_04330 [Myxococcales bacterium]|nr:hypothetical protein [Myxococcales bacterium]